MAKEKRKNNKNIDDKKISDYLQSEEEIDKEDNSSEEQESKDSNKPLMDKKDLFWVGAFILSIVFAIFVIYFIFNSYTKIEYEGLTFVKEKYGDLVFYKYVYNFNSNGKILTYNYYIQNNPLENNIPVEGGKIEFPKGKQVFLTINETGINTCKMSNLAVGSLASFITNNQLKLTTGLADRELAIERNRTHVTCDTNKNNPVIYLRQGEETKITIDGLCYNIEIASCDDILKATERFTTQTIIDARNRS